MAAHKSTVAGPNPDRYKALFKEADKDGSGCISIVEMRNMLLKLNSKLTDRQVAEFFIFLDGPQGDRQITYEEFCKGLDVLLDFTAKVKQLFKELDTSGNGLLDRNELKCLLKKTGKNFTEAEVDQILKDADKNGDNQISYEEFISACT